jgi:DNA-binding NarL/FixJ family response regulator
VGSAEKALRVVIADDDRFFRDGLREVLSSDGIEVVGELTEGTGAPSMVAELTPDMIVIDLNMLDGWGIEPIRQIVAAVPDVRVLVLTASDDEADAIEALAAGACGYIPKDARVDDIVGAVRQAAGGFAVLPHDLLRALLERLATKTRLNERTAHPAPDLTARELEVLRLIAGGANNAAIGQALSISKHTVKQYVSNILEKLGLQSRVQAAVYAVRAGLV